jgi:hypothetical protein
LQEDCNGAGPILPFPKTKKLAFWDWGALFYKGLYGPVKCGVKRKEMKVEPGAPPNSARKMGYAV